MVMYFAPHLLQVLIEAHPEYDSDGQVIVADEERWETVGSCRCDDDGTKKLKSDNGEVYMSSYHIVYEGEAVKPGSHIRCMSGEQIRGDGVARHPQTCNYFDYSEVWI